jgi:hypothetical protein
LLAGGLARRTKRETAVGWIAGVVKKTWWPFRPRARGGASSWRPTRSSTTPRRQTIGQAFALAFH